MGWFWNKSSSQKPTDTDPLRDLDPSLRDFLSKESPVKYKPAPAPPPSPSTQTTTTSSSSFPPVTSTSDTPPKVPPESLYQDGRFAHLWSTYRPLAVIENETKSDQERLSDVLEGYKERKAQIGRAAVESCVEEQIRLNDCYENGSWRDRIMMCRTESRAFERCYIMQSRFLKALGYLSTYDRPPEVDEKIQMHADTLYHRMLAQEKATDEAKAAGQPAPTFAPILSGDTASSSSPKSPTTDPPAPAPSPSAPIPSKDKKVKELPLQPITQSFLTPQAQQSLRERLKDLTPVEREVEERSVQMEARAVGEMSAQVKQVEEGRKKRREKGNGTVGDTVSGWFGW